MSEARGTVLRLDVGRQPGLELEHGAALRRLALEVRQVLQGLVGVHPLEVASANKYINLKSTEKTEIFICATCHLNLTIKFTLKENNFMVPCSLTMTIQSTNGKYNMRVRDTQDSPEIGLSGI